MTPLRCLAVTASLVLPFSSFPDRGSATAAQAEAPKTADSSGSLYLSPTRTGSRWCLDPESAELRARAVAPELNLDDRVPGSALADTVRAYRDALRESYGRWDQQRARTDFHVDEYFDAWMAELRRQPEVTVRDGLERKVVELSQRIRDAHLGLDGVAPVTVPPVFREYQTVVPNGFDATACRLPTDRGVAPDTLRTARSLRRDGRFETVLTVSALGGASPETPLTLTCAGKPRALAVRALVPSPDTGPQKPTYDLRAVSISGVDVGIVTIPRFYPASAGDDAQLARQTEEYDLHRKHQVLVFDFRGNPGGSDLLTFEWIVKAKAGGYAGAPGWERKSGIEACMDWNRAVLGRARRGQLDAPEAVARRRKIQEEWPYRVSDPPAFERDEVITKTDGTNPFAGAIFVVVDKNSASAAETSAEALRRAMGAIIVGERSAGVAESINVASVLLPSPAPGRAVNLVAWIPQGGVDYGFPLEFVGLPVSAYVDVTAPIDVLIPGLLTLARR